MEDTEDWRPRTGTTQSRSFKILAQITGTENGTLLTCVKCTDCLCRVITCTVISVPELVVTHLSTLHPPYVGHIIVIMMLPVQG